LFFHDRIFKNISARDNGEKSENGLGALPTENHPSNKTRPRFPSLEKVGKPASLPRISA